MKLLCKVFFLLTIFNFSIAEYNLMKYSAIIKPCVKAWQDECIDKLLPQDIVIIADMLLLSYQVVQSSCIMSQARLIIQTELLKIITLSIDDTLQARLQAENNDLSIIKKEIIAIEQAQEKMKYVCNALKSFGPFIIHIDPAAIQHFIAHVKTVILHWIKTQKTLALDFKEIEQEFTTIPDLFNNVQTIFEKIYFAEKTESFHLIEGTHTLNSLYKNIETIYAHLTSIRQESILHFNHLLTLYFKYHYELLYDYIQNSDLHDYAIIATKNQQFPKPEEFFFIE